MGKKKRIDPEERARWAEARRRMEQMLERRERESERLLLLAQRRRARIRRLTFGLLPR